ncbi:hypothetical protein [Deinococcus cellulosilyticus]|uniref:hypothetical protein n=1 Tax=Deinococcus cellulosilyticus TaxID=401558 RepID=UPI0011BE338B|nr:hypothetical protein [Deinococcus cellulosilyticus]
MEIRPEGDRIGIVLHEKPYLVKCSGNRVQVQPVGTKQNMFAPFVAYDISSQKFTLDRTTPQEHPNRLVMSCAGRGVHFAAGAHLKLVHQIELNPEVFQSH